MAGAIAGLGTANDLADLCQLVRASSTPRDRRRRAPQPLPRASSAPWAASRWGVSRRAREPRCRPGRLSPGGPRSVARHRFGVNQEDLVALFHLGHPDAAHAASLAAAAPPGDSEADQRARASRTAAPVSYTHLTLPTIYSV